MGNNTCLVCGLGSNNSDGIDFQGKVICPRCGTYSITDKARKCNQNDSTNLPSPKLSAWIRNKNERGETEILIDDINKILQSLPDYSVSEKQLILLRNIERKSEHPGSNVSLDSDKDYPLAWAGSNEEFRFYIDALEQRGLLKRNGMCDIVITSQGFDFLDKNRRNFEEKTQCFVAMSFDEKMDAVWLNAIKHAIEKAGYKPYRIDKEQHIDRIDAKIIAEIRNSRFLVADVTDQKGSVYFEAGFALGLGLPVIWSVRKDDLKNVHFDTRQYNHIVWKEEADLYEQLYDSIRANIGKRGNTTLM